MGVLTGRYPVYGCSIHACIPPSPGYVVFSIIAIVLVLTCPADAPSSAGTVDEQYFWFKLSSSARAHFPTVQLSLSSMHCFSTSLSCRWHALRHGDQRSNFQSCMSAPGFLFGMPIVVFKLQCALFKRSLSKRWPGAGDKGHCSQPDLD